MKNFLAIFFLLSMLSSNVSAQSAWTQKADCGGGGRWHGISFSIGNKGYVGLGQDSNGYANNFWEYNQSSDTWTQKANFPGTTRNDGIGFSIGGKGYVGLGISTASHATNEFWEYDTLNDTWTQKANFPLTNTFPLVGGYGFFCFSVGNKGYAGIGNEIWEYDPVADNWTQKANSTADALRSGAVGFSIGQKGYMGLGIDPNLFPYPAYFGDLWEYNPSTDSWIQKAYFPGGGRIAAVGFSINGKGYIGTGQDKNNNWYNDFWQYDTLTNVWIQKENVGGPVRYYAFGFGIPNKGYIGGGSEWDTTGIYNSRDFWEYDPTLDTLSGIKNFTSQINRFSIYPNPCIGKFQVSSFNLQITRIDVYNIIGEIVYKKIINSPDKNIRTGKQLSTTEIDLSNHPAGLYNVCLTTEQGILVKKIIIDH